MRAVGIVLTASLLAGCELDDEIVAPSEPVVVVHAVLDPAAAEQFVVVERAENGATDRGPFGFSVPPGPSGSAIADAIVTLTHLDAPSECAAPTVTLAETPLVEGLPTGVYVTSALCALASGDRVALRVETPDGEVVTGTTRIPGADNVTVLVAGRAAEPARRIDFFRDRESVVVSVGSHSGRGIQVELVTRGFLGPAVTFLTDTTVLEIAGDFQDPFDDVPVFEAGQYRLLTVAVTDTNYFDFARSGADVLTGRGFINHLEGGIGVFGSVWAATYELRVVAEQTDPREGVYRLEGVVGGMAVDVQWDLYLDESGTVPGFRQFFNAFVVGTVGDSTVDTGAYVEVFEPEMHGVLDTGSRRDRAAGIRVSFRGVPRSLGTPFSVEASIELPGMAPVSGTLTMVQLMSP